MVHSVSTVYEKQRGAGRLLCLLQSHDSTEGTGEEDVEGKKRVVARK